MLIQVLETYVIHTLGMQFAISLPASAADNHRVISADDAPLMLTY